MSDVQPKAPIGSLAKPVKQDKKPAKRLKRKWIKQYGKQSVKWKMYRQRYLLTHQSVNGFYQCAICNLPIPEDEVTLDHIVPRSRAPQLKYKDFNIQFAHGLCNSDKGSRVLE